MSNPATTAPNNDSIRFPSLASFRARYSELLQLHRKQEDAPDVLDQIEAFIARGQATGALLDGDEEREVAQDMLDYWSAILYRAGREAPDATLDDFDESLAPEIPDELCPYVGLDAFRGNQQNVFFGRTRLVQQLVETVQTEQLLSVVGPSGSGKSSLVLAGLLPQLQNGAIEGSETWRYYPRMVPGSDPLANLAQLFIGNELPDHNEGTEADTTSIDWIQLQVQQFRNKSDHLLRLIDADGGNSEVTEAPRTVLMIDQFEEIFTLCRDEEVRNAFVKNLLSLIQSKTPSHLVLLTMRSDFENQIALLPEFQPHFEQSMVRVTPLNARELRQAIEEPAAQVGLKFEEGIVDALLQDILGEPAALPLLQFTLLKLWENRERNRITWDAYQRLGGGRMALANSADTFYNDLIPEEQVTAKRILLRLVRPGEGLEVTSNRVQVETLYQAGEARDRVDRVLQKFLDARLLRLSEGDSAVDSQVEVAHEALVRNWPRLVGWLEDERETIRERLRLTRAAEQWSNLDRDPSALWRGALLAEARRYQDLNELEASFVQASHAAERAVEREKEAARKRELEQARALAEAERQRAEEQAQTTRRLRTLLIALAALFAATVIAFIYAYQSQNRAATAEVAVTRAVATAAEAQEDAEQAEATAIEAVANVAEIQETATVVVATATQQAVVISATVEARVSTVFSETLSLVNQGSELVNQEEYGQAVDLFSRAIVLDPSNVAAYFQRGTSYTELMSYTLALEDFNRVIELEPEQASPYFRRGIVHTELMSYTLAADDFWQTIQLKPSWIEATFRLGKVHTELSEYKKAVADFSRTIELAPTFARAYTHRGAAYRKLGMEDEAFADYKTALELGLDESTTYLEQGDIHAIIGEYAEAIEDYNRAIELNSNDVEAHIRRGIAYSALEEHLQAVADFSVAIGLQPDSIEAYLNRGIAYSTLGFRTSSIADFNQAIRLNPDNADAYAHRGMTQYRLRRYEQAVTDFSEAIRIEPTAQRYLERGKAYLRLGQNEAAAQDFDSAIAQGMEETAVYMNRGLARKRLEDFQGAMADFTQILEQEPENINAHLERGHTNYAWGKHRESIEDYAAAIDLDHTLTPAYVGRGHAFYALRNYQEAITDYTSAILLDSNSANAYFYRGNAYYALRQYQDALPDLNKAIELDPDFANAYLYRGHIYSALSAQNYSETTARNPNLNASR